MRPVRTKPLMASGSGQMEIYALTGKRAVLAVDRVALVRNELRELLVGARGRNVPLAIIGAERDNEWNVYCDQLEPFVRQEFPVRYLNEKEIGELVSLLERHNALGLLKDRSPEERLQAFMDVAQRQLLVALHQVTLGVAFEDIVFDEYESIPSDAATAQNLRKLAKLIVPTMPERRRGFIARPST